MKILLLNIALFVGIPAVMQAQHITLPVKDEKVFYEVVDSTVKDLTKTRLYNLSKLWVVNYFKTAKVIQLDNPDDGMIVGSGSFPFRIKEFGSVVNNCYYSFNITSKDGKYRVQFYDILFTMGLHNTQVHRAEELNMNPEKRLTLKYQVSLDQGINEMIQSLQYSIHHANETSNF